MRTKSLFWFILVVPILLAAGSFMVSPEPAFALTATPSPAPVDPEDLFEGTITPLPPPPPRIDPPIIEPPILPPPEMRDALRIAYQRVDVTIDNQVATTRIDQLFVNDGNRMLEGTYFFPLPPGATVSELTMWIDGQPIESKILPKDEARQIYDAIVRQLRDPALLEYVEQDAIQANVFPIPAGEERRIEIEYQQVLPAENGLVHFVYPQTNKLYTNRPLEQQSIRVEILSNEAIRTIYSPSHPVAINQESDFRAVAGFEDSDVAADIDFELYYGVSPEEIGLNLISYKEPGQDGFFLLLAAPSVEVDPADIIARDMIFVLDTSGSMEGEKLAQAQTAAISIIDQLNAFDRFNVIAFSTGTRAFNTELIPTGDAGNYAQFINSLEALGGTNISQSLLEAAAQVQPERPTTIIFLTDGIATEGIVDTQELLNEVEATLPANARLFAFGVGDDVDTFLLDSLTSNHRGTTSYVRPYQSIDEELASFYNKISTPVLADVTLDYGSIIAEQTYPEPLPDIFAGTQLVLAGRYREGGPTTITLSGDVNGETQTFVYEDITFVDNGGDEFIPRLWATRAIGDLLQRIRLEGESPELVESVVNLSIRYGIITPYTSYLIEEDDIFSQLGRERIIEEEMESFEEDEAVSGADAVDEAAAAGGLSAAEAPLAPPMPLPTGTAVAGASPADGAVSLSNQPVRFVGSKTFVNRDGRWIDTAYDESQAVQTIGFASDSYFNLLSAAPELGPYLALGEEVTVVHDGVTYQTVPGEGDTIIAPPADLPSDGGPGESAPPPATVAALDPTVTAAPVEPTSTAESSVEPTTTVSDATDQPATTDGPGNPVPDSSFPTARVLLAAAAAFILLILFVIWRRGRN